MNKFILVALIALISGCKQLEPSDTDLPVRVGPDEFGVVCYRFFTGTAPLSCVKVTK